MTSIPSVIDNQQHETCSSTPEPLVEPLVHFTPKWYAGFDESFTFSEMILPECVSVVD